MGLLIVNNIKYMVDAPKELGGMFMLLMSCEG